MKFLVMTKARAVVSPPKDSISAVQEAVKWIEARLADGTTDCAYGIVPSMSANVMNADSHEELWNLITDYRFLIYGTGRSTPSATSSSLRIRGSKS